MRDFVHLHVHTQYSLLDGQASIPALVDKALADGMKGMAVTDHGNMMGIKEFFNYVNKVKGKAKGALAEAKAKLEQLDAGTLEIPADTTADALRKSLEAEVAKQAPRAAFMPIFGCEMYVARRGDKTLREGKVDQSGWHLVVLAKNEQGYHNLIRLVSRSWVDGFYMRPRTDPADLEQFHEGLIVCSACLGGEVPRKILDGDIDGARRTIAWYKRVFGDDYYLEIQRHQVTDSRVRANRDTYPLQQRANAIIMQLAEETQTKVLCTNDCHFVNEENGEAHDRLICLATGKDLDDPSRMLYTKQEWFKTRAEMEQVFADVPEVMDCTMEVLAKVEAYSIDHAPIMPNFDIPADFGTEEEYRQKYSYEDLYNEFTCDENGKVVLSREDGEAKIKKLGGYEKLYRIKLEADYLGKLAYEGAAKRYPMPLTEEVDDRLRFELHIMKTMGFPGYFLIVQDYIRAAREELDVSVGPGRGSAAGSAVAYCLGISQIDPINFDLLFEGFWRPDRSSRPGIDVDFDDDGRGRVLSWVMQKYHAENCAHIITYGTMATKLAIKDVARVQKLPLDISNRLCKAIPDKLPEGPDGKVPKMNLPNAIAAIPELREAEASSDPLLHDTIRYAKMLEGNVRNTGVHACGFIICRDPISDWVPVSTAEDKETGEKVACTQYEGRVIEETGLIKMDFLGLKTLSIIKEAVQNIYESLNVRVDIDKIPIDDPATYQLYCNGSTIGTFQFESTGMQRYLIDLQPSTFEDLIAMNALYRPGPMQYIPQFIKRKHGEEPIVYDLPCMEKYLKDTYGITVYQEQGMLLSREIADFTRGESDALRKAMGKKLIDKLNHMYPKFIKGGTAKGYDPKVLEKIWEDWRAFASYAFNKSHATCYSWVAYQTAYLKANYPAQYMAGVMSRSLADIRTITKLMDECKSMGIRTLGPHINESREKFSVNSHGDIRFGLAAIKGVGGAAVQSILNERKAHGPYKDIYDFVERINHATVNRKCLESLALAGAFDEFDTITREQYVAENPATRTSFIEDLIRYGRHVQEEKAQAVASLFDGFAEAAIAHPVPPKGIVTWSDLERLNHERDLIGIYISGHPLDKYAVIVEHGASMKAAQLADAADYANTEVSIAGIVTSVVPGRGKDGRPYGTVYIEDYSGTGDFRLWSDEWARWSGYFAEGNIVLIKAMYKPRRYNPAICDITIGQVDFLPELIKRCRLTLHVNIRIDLLSDSTASELIAKLSASNAPAKTDAAPDGTPPCRLEVDFKDPLRRIHIPMTSALPKITVNRDLLQFLDQDEAINYSVHIA